MVSKREKKKAIAEGVKALRSKAGWDPTTFKNATPQQALRELDQSKRSESVYEESDERTCPECSQKREATRDPTALCDAHFSEILGF